MADIIATESEAKSIGGSSLTVTANLMCTKARAEALGCEVLNLNYYTAQNQLVKLSDLVAAYHPNTISIISSYTYSYYTLHQVAIKLNRANSSDYSQVTAESDYIQESWEYGDINPNDLLPVTTTLIGSYYLSNIPCQLNYFPYIDIAGGISAIADTNEVPSTVNEDQYYKLYQGDELTNYRGSYLAPVFIREDSGNIELVEAHKSFYRDLLGYYLSPYLLTDNYYLLDGFIFAPLLSNRLTIVLELPYLFLCDIYSGTKYFSSVRTATTSFTKYENNVLKSYYLFIIPTNTSISFDSGATKESYTIEALWTAPNRDIAYLPSSTSTRQNDDTCNVERVVIANNSFAPVNVNSSKIGYYY